MIVCLIFALAAALISELVKKCFSMKFANGAFERHVYNAVTSVTILIVLFLWGGMGKTSLFTVVLGSVFGVVNALVQIMMFKAMELGPWSYTYVIASLSTLISALSGVMFFGEHLSLAQVLGIIMMCMCLVLSVEPDTENKQGSLRWFLYSMATFFLWGAVGVMQKFHQVSQYKEELNAFLIIAFTVCFVFSAAAAVIVRKKETYRKKTELTKAIWIAVMVIGGISYGVGSKLNLYLAGTMDSAVFFPIINGGTLILVVLTAFAIFKERPTGKQWIGILVGILSVIFLCDPF